MEEMWNDFNLRENNLDQGGGILYSLRYSTESLEEKRKGIVKVLENIGISIIDIGDQYGVNLPQEKESDESY